MYRIYKETNIKLKKPTLVVAIDINRKTFIRVFW